MTAANTATRRIGVMGGTFDPIHNAHVGAACEALAQCQLDEVVFVPTGVPWQKEGRGVSDAEHRYAMTLLATQSHPRFRVSRVDIERRKPTYTADTLRDLDEEYGPGTELFFIAGADIAESVLSWKFIGEVFAQATFVLVNRPNAVLSTEHWPPAAKVVQVEMPALDISSTDCRRRAAAQRPLRYLVPESVGQYIASRGLYDHD
ncbi:MAG TPA: nicotinate-nucleotide adenylyltransferase [Candidatus Stackebrandtia faecavium]|nr:nicotinate-nucleotide adenylyltransferase [Candidatus Stackebrandtia faecavium]